MKKFIFILLLGCASVSWGQTDTLYEENLRKAADLIFKNLDSSLYGPSLLNRSFTVNPVIREQLQGNYRQTHTLVEFLFMYQDLSQAYIDSTYMMDIPDLSSYIDSVFLDIELNPISNSDDMILPFGLVYHYVSAIDSEKFTGNQLKVEDHSYVTLVEERLIYSNHLLKSCAVLDFFPDNGYNKGYLKYSSKLFSFSPDITNVKIKINVGEGFVNFNQENSLIAYDRYVDSTIGKIALEYTHNGRIKFDSLDFFLVARGESNINYNKDRSSFWDIEQLGTGHSGVTMKYAVKFGCGTEFDKTRRIVIIVPPYRPKQQNVSFEQYYNQFNFANLLDILHNMGYDIYFIKQSPGNASLESAANALIQFIINRNEEKQLYHPNESWENVIIGFSMGGQIARYALKKMEYEHMENRGPHHHTRLYIPFDSPHQGANIPMFTQFVYQDMKNINVFAHMSYNALVDEASKDMGICHLLGCSFIEENFGSALLGPMKIRTYNPGITAERTLFLEGLNNWYNHEYTSLYDLRRTYPSFTRNVAVSVGRNDKNYTLEYQLNPGKLIFDQNTLGLSLTGFLIGVGPFQIWERKINVSKFMLNHTSFSNKMTLLLPPFVITFKNIKYRLNNGMEWDMAQGGYKNEFWDKTGQVPGTNLFSVPVGPVAILNNFGMFGNQNNKLYEENMSFLPLVSSLHINPTIWQNNNLFYNPKTQGLMYNKFGFIIGLDESNTYGYPNLGHPSNHFNITPFEAIYCDNQTYEHIKMQASIDDDQDLNPIYLVHTRNFVVNEIESDVVYLQNKTIGKNHIQNVPTYKYRAWYKAYTRIEIGNLVTPKTDPGDYVIEATGDITVYAGESVVLKPGFHAQNGSTFHAFIKRECAQPPMNVPDDTGWNDSNDANEDPTKLASNTNETETVDEIVSSGNIDRIDSVSLYTSVKKSEIAQIPHTPFPPAHKLPMDVFAVRIEED